LSHPISNLNSYENFELLKNFSNEKILEEYRAKKLNEASRTINFLKKFLSTFQLKNGITILDLGSGNSKLLFQLSKENLLKKGYGVEISKSRFEFAEKWKSDLKLSNVKNINSNFLEIDFSNLGQLDVVVCEDYTLQFLEPIKKNSVRNLLSEANSSLTKDGFLLLELSNMDKIENNISKNYGIYKTWDELDKDDPFAYLIQDMSFDNHQNIVINKRFIHRTESVESSSSKTKYVLKPYSKDEISEILKESGFTQVEIFEEFEEDSFQCQPHECYVVIARKRSK